MHLKEQLKLETTYKIFTLQNYNRTMHHAIPKSEYFINPSFYRLHNSLQQRQKAKCRSRGIKTPKEFTQTAFRQILSAFHFMETVFRFCGFGKDIRKAVCTSAERAFTGLVRFCGIYSYLCISNVFVDRWIKERNWRIWASSA